MLTIDDMFLEEAGNYRCGKFSMIPYQHHKNKIIWRVFVIMNKEATENDDPEQISDYISVIADTSRKAAFESIELFNALQDDKVKCKEIIKEMKAIRKLEKLNETRDLQQIV